MYINGPKMEFAAKRRAETERRARAVAEDVRIVLVQAYAFGPTLAISDATREAAARALAGLKARESEDVGEWAEQFGRALAATPSDFDSRLPEDAEVDRG